MREVPRLSGGALTVPRLTPEQRSIIPADYAELGSYAAVARKHGVSVNTVKAVINGPQAGTARELQETARDSLEQKVVSSLNDLASEIIQVRDQLRKDNGKRVAVEWTVKQLTLIASALKSVNVTIDNRKVELHQDGQEPKWPAIRERLRKAVQAGVLDEKAYTIFIEAMEAEG